MGCVDTLLGFDGVFAHLLHPQWPSGPQGLGYQAVFAGQMCNLVTVDGLGP